VTVFVTPVGKVVWLLVPVVMAVPDTVAVLDFVLRGDPDALTEPVEVFEELLDPVIVEVLYIVRVSTMLNVVQGLVLLVLDEPGERVTLPETVDVFEEEDDPVSVGEALDDLLL
jgi:hypothetical protein